MLKCYKFIVLVIGGLSLIGSSLAWAAQGYMYEARGDVTAATGAALPLAVKKDQLLPDNTTIAVGPKSSATLKFEDGTVILLNENTTFQIQKYAYNDKDPSKISALFSMLKGGLRAVTGLISSRNREAFKVATPLATIGIRGTEFMVQLVNPLYMQVLSGAVNLSNPGGTGIFSAGQTALVPSPTGIARSIPAAPAGTFGAMPAAKLPPPVPAKVPAAAKPAAKVAAKPAAKVAVSLEQAKVELKAPGDLAKKVEDLSDKGVSASVIIAAIAEVADKDAVIAAIAVLISKGADPAAVTSAAIAAGADAAAVTAAAVKAAPAAAAAIVTAAVTAGASPTVVQSAAIGAGADPTTVTTAAAAGAQPQAPVPSGTAPAGTPVPGGGGSGTPVSPS